MDALKILKVTATYRERFESKGIQPKRHRNFLKPSSRPEINLAHCYYMINEIDKFVEAGRIDKAFRWLDFVQAILRKENEYTIEQLKDHKRPDKK